MSFDLDEKITVWNKLPNEGYGPDGFTSPVVVDGRHADVQEKVTNIDGDQVMSKGVVYSDSTLIKIDSKIFIGESKAIEPPEEADDVIKITNTPSGFDDLRKIP